MIMIYFISSFLGGYYFAKWRNKKQLEIARLTGIGNFISAYCEKLKEMCESMLEKVKDESIAQEEKVVLAPMLSTISNIHDELIEIWNNSGETQLAELLGEKISDKDTFGIEIDKKMSKLVEFEDELSTEDSKKALKHIEETFIRIKEIKLWLNEYVNDPDSYIKTVAIEATALLLAKEAVLKALSGKMTVDDDTFDEEATSALAKQGLYTQRYTNAMQLLSGA